MEFYFITGASGVGKTTLLDQLAKKHLHWSSWVFHHFDSMGVPSVEEMIKQYGSPAGWQEAMTYNWIDKIVKAYATDTEFVFLEGQVDPAFIIKGFERLNLSGYHLVLIDCSEKEMAYRLTHKRKQPELLNEDMCNWLKFLRKRAQDENILIIDTTKLSPEEALESFQKVIESRAALRV